MMQRYLMPTKTADRQTKEARVALIVIQQIRFVDKRGVGSETSKILLEMKVLNLTQTLRLPDLSKMDASIGEVLVWDQYLALSQFDLPRYLS